MNRFAALILLAVSPCALGKDPNPSAKGLVLHEWGVYRVNEDADFASADMRSIWDDLPPFVYGHIKGRAVPQHWGAIEIFDRPIIFFHAETPTVLRLKVDFPGGMAGVWYPATERPAVMGLEKQPQPNASLEWALGVKRCPQGWSPKSPTPVEIPDKHWFARLRQVKSDEIFSHYSPNPNDVERERFVYYDGLFPQGKWVNLTVQNDRISLTNRVKHPVFDATIVDRRDGGKVRIGRIARLNAGETIKDVALTEVDASRFTSDAAGTLGNQLVAAGLFEEEARALIDLWKRELFETSGLNLFYRIPQEEYDARLPLTWTPKPESVVRVGLIYHGHLEPDFAERVLELVKKLDAPKFADRDAAMKALLSIGPAALVQLQRLREQKDLSVEVRERVDSLIKKWNVRAAFDP